MKSSEFLFEGDDKNIEDVQVNHPDVYAFLVNIVGSMALKRQSRVEAYNTAGQHMVRVVIQPSPGSGNLKAGLKANGILFRERWGIDDARVFAGKIGDNINWNVTHRGERGNMNEIWRFGIEHDGEQTATYHDRTMD